MGSIEKYVKFGLAVIVVLIVVKKVSFINNLLASV